MSAIIETDLSESFAAFDSMQAAVAAGPRDPDIAQGMQTALDINDGYQRREFSGASHGDGFWPDLADSTKYERLRKAAGGFKRTKGISAMDRVPTAPFILPVLYITGDLYSSLVPGAPGHFAETTDKSIASGTEIYFAHFHQEGGAHLPQRMIIIPPDSETLQQMTGAVVNGVQLALSKAID